MKTVIALDIATDIRTAAREPPSRAAAAHTFVERRTRVDTLLERALPALDTRTSVVGIRLET